MTQLVWPAQLGQRRFQSLRCVEQLRWGVGSFSYGRRMSAGVRARSRKWGQVLLKVKDRTERNTAKTERGSDGQQTEPSVQE